MSSDINPSPGRAPDQPSADSLVLDASPAWRRNAVLILLALVAVGLRVAAARGDLVLDEIWSLTMASRADSAWQIFVIPHDNNHILNTLVLYTLGPNAEPLVLRLPAVAAGSLALWFAVQLARRLTPGAEIPVMILLGFSHILILFGSEARGYGYLVGCTLAAWWAIEDFLDQPRSRSAAAFALASSLGLLSHLTFVFADAAFVVYSGLALRSRRGGWRQFVVLHALPVLTGIVLFFTYVLGMSIGAGNPSPLLVTLVATLSLAAGGPQYGPAAVAAAAAMTVLVGVSLVFEFRANRLRGILYVVAIVLAPGFVLAVTQHQFIYPRYFIVPMIFAYVAVGTLLARWFRSGHFGQAAATVLLTGYLACNFTPVMRLISHGRAEFSEAMRWMAENTAGAEVALASDHDFRNSMVAFYHAGRTGQTYGDNDKKLSYIGQEQYPPQGAEWFLRHSFDGDVAPPDRFTDPNGNMFELVKVFPARSISGWTWWLYRRLSKGD
jgi:hypothetical protein